MKLLKLISEIKIRGSITPEEVYDLFSKIWVLTDTDMDWDEGDDESLDDIIVEILDKYNITTDEDIRAYEELSKNQLNQLYKDLQQFAQKYNII